MTSLMRYDPRFDILSSRSFFDDVLDEMLRPFRPSLLERWLEWPRFTMPWELAGFDGMFWRDNLAVDVYETDDEVVVKAALPGVPSENVEIEECNGRLTIRAKEARKADYRRFGWVVRERRFGAWQRTVQLPVAVKGDQAKAELVDGILTVRLPKAASGKRLVNRIKRLSESRSRTPSPGAEIGPRTGLRAGFRIGTKVSLPRLSLPKLGKKEHTIKVKRV